MKIKITKKESKLNEFIMKEIILFTIFSIFLVVPANASYLKIEEVDPPQKVVVSNKNGCTIYKSKWMALGKKITKAEYAILFWLPVN